MDITMGYTFCTCKYIETKIKIFVTLATSYTEHENSFLPLSLDL